jgi:hypothetical protein
MTHRTHKSSKCILLLLWSHLRTLLVGPPPPPPRHPIHWIISRISSNLQGLQNQLSLHSTTLSGKANLRFLVSHETLFSRNTLWGVLVGTAVAAVFTVTASRNYSGESDFIFLKWTTGNTWSNIGNYCRSNLEKHAIFIFSKGTQRLAGTISHVQASAVPEVGCVCTSVDETYRSRKKLNSQT